MAHRQNARVCLYATIMAIAFNVADSVHAAGENGNLLTGKAAMGDWTSDAPGVKRKITLQDLPPPGSNVLAINRPHVVNRPADTRPKVPPGFEIELYASGFRDPRFLLTAPNGDIFVVESRANRIKVLRDTNADGKPEVTEIFAERSLNKPFGIAFYPPGDDPQFLYVANTDGVIRFPYKGDIFAAFHGSRNRVKRTGYKVVRVPFDQATGKPRREYEDFVTGFITPEGKVWGRPVGIVVARDGSLPISEDGNGTIWRVTHGR